MAKGQTGAASKDVAKTLAHFGLSESQLLAVTYFLSGKSKQEAAALSGYSDISGSALFRGAKVQAAIAAACERFLVGELAPAAIHTISRLLADKATPAGVAGNLALGVLDRSGFSAKRFDKQGELGKDASAMTSAELQAEIDKLSREIEGRMVDVTPDGAPDSEPLTAQDLDMYA